MQHVVLAGPSGTAKEGSKNHEYAPAALLLGTWMERNWKRTSAPARADAKISAVKLTFQAKKETNLPGTPHNVDWQLVVI